MTTEELKELIDEKILSDLIQYCELNNITFGIINKMLKDSLTIMKYGDKPPMFNSEVSHKDVIVEKINETPKSNEADNIDNSKIVLVDTPLEVPDLIPSFTNEKPKKSKRTLNVK